MREELDMLFLLEHFSIEDLVNAEEKYIKYQENNTNNIESLYSFNKEYDEDMDKVVITTEYFNILNTSWMNLDFVHE